MTALDRATDIRLKDGTIFSVHSPGGGRVIVATPIDEAVEATGLAAYRSEPVGSSGLGMHTGMPVEIVRSYCRAHGGVAEIGETAQRLLRTLPSAADPPMGEPTDSQVQAVEEAAPESPLPEARGADLAGRTSAAADARALAEPVVGGEPALVLDELTTAVIEARRAVADFEGPVLWKREWGKPRVDRLPEISALWRRISKGAGLASRLIVVTQPRYASHPLQAEGVRLRAQLQRIGDEAFAMKRDRDEAEIEHYQRLNGVLAEG